MGLTSAELRAYHEALRAPTVLRRFRFGVYDMNDRPLTTLHPQAVDGQIVVNRRTTPSRLLTLTLVDPRFSTDFDPDSPGATGLHYTRQLRVSVGTFVPDLDEWVTCTPFYGPVRAFERDGDLVHVTGHGRDALGMGRLWVPMGRKKGTRKTDAIKALLDRFDGGHRRHIPNLPARLPAPLNLGRYVRPLPQARRLATSMNRQLFFDGPGYATLRAWPSRTVFTFDDYLTGPVKTSRQLDGVINTVEVLGRKPRGHKNRVRAVATLRPGGANMSAAALAPDGGGRVWLVRTIKNDHVRSVKEARALAERTLDDASLNLVSIRFDSLPVYHLDEGDMVAVDGHRFRLDEWTMPLHAGEGGEDGPPMTVGYAKRTARA